MASKCWLIRERAWQEIDDPVPMEDGTAVHEALLAAGYTQALSLGTPDGGHEFSADVWAHSARYVGAGAPYGYLCIVEVANTGGEYVYCASLPDLLWLCGQVTPLVPRKPVHVIEVDERLRVNADRVAYVSGSLQSIEVHFTGGEETLYLSGDRARWFMDAYGRLIDHYGA